MCIRDRFERDEQFGRRFGPIEREHCADRDRGFGHQRQGGARNDAERAGTADEQLLQVQPDIVLPQRGAQSQRAGFGLGRHQFDAEQVAADIAITQEAVSYTHLDVYKRQT